MDPGRENPAKKLGIKLKGAYPCVPRGISRLPRRHPVYPGNLGISGTSSSVSGHFSVCEYPCRGSKDGHLADGRLWPERHWALALYRSRFATCPGEPWGVPQDDALLTLDKVGTMGSWMHAGLPFPLRSAALPPIRFLPGAPPGSQCPQAPTPGSRSKNRCHGERRVGRPWRE